LACGGRAGAPDPPPPARFTISQIRPSEDRSGMLTAVVEPRYRWSFAAPVELDPSFVEAGRRNGFSDRMVDLLGRRGVTEAELAGFAGPAEAGLFAPELLPDADVFA